MAGFFEKGGFLDSNSKEIIAGAQGLSAINSALALMAQGEFQKNAAYTNASYSDMQAEDAVYRGQKNAENYMKKVNQIQGKQTASLAAQGVDVASGSAAKVQESTHNMGALDASTIRVNAYKEAFGYKTQAINQRLQGDLTGISSAQAANNTLITGGLSIAEKYAKWNSPSSTTSLKTEV